MFHRFRGRNSQSADKSISSRTEKKDKKICSIHRNDYFCTKTTHIRYHNDTIIKTNDMAQQAITVRLDSEMKVQFDSLCEQFGMSANTAINIFVNAVVRSQSIPFPINIPSKKDVVRENAIKAFESIRKQAEASTEPEMTLEEINEEIRLAREERKKRLGL